MKPTDNFYRVLRGGCWLNDEPSGVRAACRNSYGPAYRISYLGFRTHLSVREPRT